MKNSIFLGLFFVLFGSYGQELNSTNGERKILIDEEVIVENPKQLDSSIITKAKAITDLFLEVVPQIFPKETRQKDSLKLTATRNSLEIVYAESLKAESAFQSTVQHEYLIGDSLVEYHYRPNLISSSHEVTQINLKNGEKKRFIQQDSVLYENRTVLAIDKNLTYKDLKIVEFKDKTRVIEGYTCFKIIATIRRSSLDAFDFFEIEISDHQVKNKYKEHIEYEIKYEMYVSDQLNFHYHPEIKVADFFENLYPLELIVKNSSLPGFNKIFTVISIE